MITVEQLVELAQEVESEDPIDWAMLNISEQAAYTMIATSVLERHLGLTEDQELVLLATVVKLTVENFVLNLRLLSKMDS